MAPSTRGGDEAKKGTEQCAQQGFAEAIMAGTARGGATRQGLAATAATLWRLRFHPSQPADEFLSQEEQKLLVHEVACKREADLALGQEHHCLGLSAAALRRLAGNMDSLRQTVNSVKHTKAKKKESAEQKATKEPEAEESESEQIPEQHFKVTDELPSAGAAEAAAAADGAESVPTKPTKEEAVAMDEPLRDEPVIEDVATGDKNVGDEAPRKKCDCGFGGGLERGGCSGCGWNYSWGTWPGWQKLKGKGKGPPKLRRPGRAHGKGR